MANVAADSLSVITDSEAAGIDVDWMISKTDIGFYLHMEDSGSLCGGQCFIVRVNVFIVTVLFYFAE